MDLIIQKIIQKWYLLWFDVIRLIHQLIQKINNRIADKQGYTTILLTKN